MSRWWSPAAGHAALLLLGAMLFPGVASAQQTTLTLTNNGLAIPTGVAIDSTHYNAGWVCATGSMGYEVRAISGNTARTATLFMRANGAITGGQAGKLADLQWRIGTPCSPTVAGTGWTSLTQVDATVEAGSIKANGPANGRFFSDVVYFRFLLAWSTDLGATTFTLPQLIFTVSQ
ncbi:MAG TPA: hypothetical protein VGD77_00885 [Gemmatimonadaceae bacterium]